MRIQPTDLNGLASAYRKVLTESQETGYNRGMSNIDITPEVHEQIQIIIQHINKYVPGGIATVPAEEILKDLWDMNVLTEEYPEDLNEDELNAAVLAEIRRQISISK